MRAAVIESLPADRFALLELPDPVAAPDEVVLRVEACGICGTDLHIVDGTSYAPTLPFVLGHEPVGRVVAAGAAAGIDRRALYAITLFEGCGACRECLRGDERLCQLLRSITGVLERPGGFAELLAVPAAQLVGVPDGLSAPEAASLVDAGATAANAVRRIADTPGSCVVLGGGPVGFLVAELVVASGRTALVVEPQQDRREALRALGHAVAAGVSELAPPEVVIDCAGAPAATRWALETLRPRGTLVVVGYGPVPVFDSTPIARKELAVLGVRSGSRADLASVLELAAAGRIRLPAISEFALHQIDEAFDALRAGRVPGKAVIVP